MFAKLLGAGRGRGDSWVAIHATDTVLTNWAENAFAAVSGTMSADEDGTEILV